MKSFIFLLTITLLITSCANRRPQQSGTPQQVQTNTVNFSWPAQGKIIQGFNENKGIDIAGAMFTPIYASESGRVVFAGNTVRGYGNLIIIKHNNTFLTAYGHNKTLLVKEGDNVSKGQKIAEMGDTEANTVKLHFEIRENGKPVDPMLFLNNPKPSIKTPSQDAIPQPLFSSGDIEAVKAKCKDLGFKDKTEAFGKCVIRLSK